MEGLYFHGQCLQIAVGTRRDIDGTALTCDIYGNRKLPKGGMEEEVPWCGKAHMLEGGSKVQVCVDGVSEETSFVILEDESLLWANDEKWLKVSYTVPQLWLLQGRPRRAPLMSLAFLHLFLILFEQASYLVCTVLPINFFCNVVYVPDSP